MNAFAYAVDCNLTPVDHSDQYILNVITHELERQERRDVQAFQAPDWTSNEYTDEHGKRVRLRRVRPGEQRGDIGDWGYQS